MQEKTEIDVIIIIIIMFKIKQNADNFLPGRQPLWIVLGRRTYPI